MRGGVPRYVAQATPQFDTEIAEKGHLWMENSLYVFLNLCYAVCSIGKPS